MVNLHWGHLGIRGHHHHHHHHSRNSHQLGQKEVALPLPPKGYMAVRVGAEGEEQQQQRVVVPVAYLNHPLFRSLLHDVEELYGFDHEGPLNIPCKIEKFRRIQRIIDCDSASGNRHHHRDSVVVGGSGGSGGGGNRHGHFHCFKAS